MARITNKVVFAVLVLSLVFGFCAWQLRSSYPDGVTVWNMPPPSPNRFGEDSTSAASRTTNLTHKTSQADSRSTPTRAEHASPTTQGQTTYSRSCPCDLHLAKDVATEMKTNEAILIPHFQQRGFDVTRGAGMRRDLLDPDLEVPLFRYPPLKDTKCLPDEKMSKVSLLNSGKDLYTVGDAVRLRVDLYLACGEPRAHGGDELRIWLKSADGQSSVPAKVTDLGNGSYVADSVLAWPGKTVVRASLTYAREFLRTVVELHHTLHAMHWSSDTFANKQGVQQSVACYPSLPIPGYSKTCDQTAMNGGRPWYCGHPSKEGLNCSHFKSVNPSNRDRVPLPLSPPMREYVGKLDRCCNSIQKADLRLINNDITIDVQNQTAPSTKNPDDALPRCGQLAVKDSWDAPSPLGWLDHGTWRPFNCRLPTLPLAQIVDRCLRNTSILLLGDSNQRLIFNQVGHYLKCNAVVARDINPHTCVNRTLNTTMMFTAHALPLCLHAAVVPLPVALQRLMSMTAPGNKVVVFIHYFMHVSTHPMQVYRRLVQEARKTIGQVLLTHPHTKFLIRGPHVVYQGGHSHPHIGDNFNHWYIRFWKEEFQDMKDKVWFVDTWDLTIASENIDTHPEPVVSEVTKMLFSYVCDV